MSDVIDFEAEKNRRVHADDADAGDNWEQVRDQLIDVMLKSTLPDHSLASATLRALIDSLEEIHPNLTTVEAVNIITQCLNVFRGYATGHHVIPVIPTEGK